MTNFGYQQTKIRNLGVADDAYVVVDGSGNGDYTTISAALSAVASTGGTVYVRKGTYTLTAPLVVLRVFVWSELPGRSTISLSRVTIAMTSRARRHKTMGSRLSGLWTVWCMA